jgi:hypothetical protein
VFLHRSWTVNGHSSAERVGPALGFRDVPDGQRPAEVAATNADAQLGFAETPRVMAGQADAEHDPGHRRLRAAGAVVSAIFDGLGNADF